MFLWVDCCTCWTRVRLQVQSVRRTSSLHLNCQNCFRAFFVLIVVRINIYHNPCIGSKTLASTPVLTMAVSKLTAQHMRYWPTETCNNYGHCTTILSSDAERISARSASSSVCVQLACSKQLEARVHMTSCPFPFNPTSHAAPLTQTTSPSPSELKVSIMPLSTRKTLAAQTRQLLHLQLDLNNINYILQSRTNPKLPLYNLTQPFNVWSTQTQLQAQMPRR